MVIREMTDEECRRTLTEAHYGRLGCARDNQPYIVPIAFAYDGRHLYGFSTPGQKIDWMRSNPLVCVEIDERTSRQQWVSIVISGRFEELLDTPEFAADRAQAHRTLQVHAPWWEYTTVPVAESQRKAGSFTPIFYRIHIDKMTGHRATPRATS